MICPKCGYDMGIKYRCLRCGFEMTMPAVVDEDEQAGSEEQEKKQDEVETKIIDPTNVYLTHPYGYEDDYGTGFGPGGDPFASLFDDLFGDPIGDLLGGLFGINVNPRRTTIRREEPPKKRKKQGPIIELSGNDVEVISPDGTVRNGKGETKSGPKPESSRGTGSTTGGTAQQQTAHADPAHKSKNPFRRRKK